MHGTALILAWTAAVLGAVGLLLVPPLCLRPLPMTAGAYWSGTVMFVAFAVGAVLPVGWPRNTLAAQIGQCCAGLALLTFVLALGKLFHRARALHGEEVDDHGVPGDGQRQ